MIIIQDKQTAKAYNQLAREQLKLKLMADINMDLQICKLEWWDIKEYLIDLKNTIDSFLEK